MAKGKYILCIDDDDDDCELLQEAINRINPAFRIEFIRSGDEAIRCIAEKLEQRQKLPKVVVLDINLPGMDGREILHQLKKLLGDETVPILFITTTPSDQDRSFAKTHSATISKKPMNEQGYNDIATVILDLATKR